MKLKLARKYSAASFLLATVLVSAQAVRAQAIEVTLDPAQTEIHYTLAATAHTVHGTFRLKSGEVRYDPATGKASGAIVVDATSGTSGNNGRDSRMHREILESPKYPDIVFTPQQVKGMVNPQGASQVEVSGMFRLHGEDHDFTMPVSVQLNGGEATASTQFSIPYEKWGLKNPNTFILRVRDAVDIDIRAAAHISPVQK